MPQPLLPPFAVVPYKVQVPGSRTSPASRKPPPGLPGKLYSVVSFGGVASGRISALQITRVASAIANARLNIRSRRVVLCRTICIPPDSGLISSSKSTFSGHSERMRVPYRLIDVTWVFICCGRDYTPLSLPFRYRMEEKL